MRASLLRVVDRYIGALLYVITALLKPLFAGNAENKNVLVIKLWAIGESILALPSIKAVSEKGFNVTVLCTRQNASVFEGQEFIKRLVVYDFENPLHAIVQIIGLRKLCLSTAIDSDPYMKFSSVLAVLSGAKRRCGFENRALLYTDIVKINENEHAVMSFARLFACIAPVQKPSALVPLAMAPNDLKIPKKSLAIHAGSAPTSSCRRWPEEKFAEVCNYFTTNGWKVYLVGSVDEKRINKKIMELCKSKESITDLSGKLDIHELAYVFSKMGLVVANDSGPMHIAASVGAPTIGLFGPNSPKRWGPFGKRCIGIRKDGPVCIKPFRAKFPNCNHDHMRYLTAEDVLRAAKNIRVLA